MTVLTMKVIVVLLGLITASLQTGGRGLGLNARVAGNWGVIVGYHPHNSRSRSCYSEDYSL